MLRFNKLAEARDWLNGEWTRGNRPWLSNSFRRESRVLRRLFSRFLRVLASTLVYSNMTIHDDRVSCQACPSSSFVTESYPVERGHSKPMSDREQRARQVEIRYCEWQVRHRLQSFVQRQVHTCPYILRTLRQVGIPSARVWETIFKSREELRIFVFFHSFIFFKKGV